MDMKTATTRLVPEVHAQLVARAESSGRSVSEHLERLVLQDLDGASTPVGEALVELLNKHHAEQLDLTSKLGELVFQTRVSFYNFALLWTQIAAGKIDVKQFDWPRWAEENLVARGGAARDVRDESASA
jgi:hypothetical protein